MAYILVVDDDLVVLKVIKAALHKAGYSVATSKDGYDAIERMKIELFDLIITDVNMPGIISGFSIASSVRNNLHTKNVPIIFLTSRRENRDVIKAIEAGANDYMVKPIIFNVLLAKVKKLLNQSKAKVG